MDVVNTIKLWAQQAWAGVGCAVSWFINLFSSAGSGLAAAFTSLTNLFGRACDGFTNAFGDFFGTSASKGSSSCWTAFFTGVPVASTAGDSSDTDRLLPPV